MTNGTISIFPYLCSNISISPAYGAYILQLIRYVRHAIIFLILGSPLTYKLMAHAGVSTVQFTSSFPQIVRSLQRYSCQYNLSLGHMLSDMFHTSR
jgi:hypothetical protein